MLHDVRQADPLRAVLGASSLEDQQTNHIRHLFFSLGFWYNESLRSEQRILRLTRLLMCHDTVNTAVPFKGHSDSERQATEREPSLVHDPLLNTT